MSYSRTVIVSFSLEDILESAIGVYTRGPKYSSNIRAEEILLSDWLKIVSQDCFSEVQNRFSAVQLITQKH